MKELWFYLLFLFPGSEKYGKKIRKAERAAELKLPSPRCFGIWIFNRDADTEQNVKEQVSGGIIGG